MISQSKFRRFYQNIPIAYRLAMVVGMAFVAFAIATGVYLIGEKNIQKAQLLSSEFSDFAQKVGQAQDTFNKLKLNLILYTGRHDQNAADKFKENLSQIEAVFGELGIVAQEKHSEFIPLLTALNKKSDLIKSHFIQAEKLIGLQGYSINDGLWNKLNKSVSAVEKETSTWPNTEKLKTKLAIMRSYEADFMLRKKQVAIQKHNKAFNEFDFALWETDLDKQTHELFTTLISKYRGYLEKFAEIDQKIEITVVSLNKEIEEATPLFAQLFSATQTGITLVAQKAERTKSNTEQSITLSVGAVLSIYFLFSLWLSRSLTIPLNRIKCSMEALASGETTVEIPDCDRWDEIGEMAKTVQVFKDGLIQKQKLSVEKDRESVERDYRRTTLEKAIKQFEYGISQVLTSIDSASSGMHKTATGMNNAAHQTHRQVDRAAMNSEGATESVRAVAQATEELSMALTAISQRVNTSDRITQSASKNANQSKESIASLLAATSKVADILELIQTIADKTRLLSLNANIEATRAGAAGKGFAVVAKEVKDRATQTAEATCLVNRQITAINDEAKITKLSIDNVVRTIKEASNHSEEIARVIADQERTTKLISQNVQSASSSATDATNTISFVKDAAQDSKKIANNVSQASENLASHSRVLRNEVEDFLNGIRAA